METELFSPYIVDILVREGMRPESVLLTACCDRTLDGGFGDTYVFLCIDKIAFLTVEYDKTVSKVYNGFVLKKGKPAEQKSNIPCKKKAYLEYKLSDIKELRLVNLVASGELYIKFEDETKEPQAITAYTNACVADVAKISHAIEKIKRDGALNFAEFKDKNDEAYCPKCGMMYINKDLKVCAKCTNRKSTFKRLLKMIPKYKKNIIIAIIMILLSSALGLVQPYMSGTILFDKGLNPETGGWWYGKAGLIVGIIVATYILYTVFVVICNINMNIMAQNMMYDLKLDIFKSFQSMSMKFLTKNSIGGIMNNINNDTTAIARFFISGIPFALMSIIQFVGGITMLITLNWKIILLAAFPAFVIVVILKITNRYMWRMYQKAWNIGAKLTSNVSDSLRGVKVVKAFGKEKNEISRFDKINEKCFKINYKLCYTVNLLNPIYGLVISLVTYAIWLISGMDIVNGSTAMSYGILASTLSYFGMMLTPIQSFSSFMEWWRNAMNSARRMYDLIDAEPDVKESRRPVVIDKVKGDIDIKNVSFGYEPNLTILKNLNADIKSGEMIGIVGHSGAGKSTLINLITRMYDVDEGSISIDGYNIKDIATRTMRDNIALVSQDTYIFQGTVLENIAFANPEAKREDVIAAAKIAKAHDFIEAMPEGYDTKIGAGYRNMSGGERQRISIARAILVNPRILILDEATAALDTETEMSIQDALDNLTNGRTTLAIAHRLSTLRNADRLIVIENGEITEMGTHSELVKNKGVYYRLMLKQAEALKTKGV